MQSTKQQRQPDTTITKRIGSTVYRVSVHFSKTGTESIEDKIIRLINNDPAFRKAG